MNKILLVTSALHMSRSIKIFCKVGVETIPATTDFLSVKNDDSKVFALILDLLPSAEALKGITNAIKEYIELFRIY